VIAAASATRIEGRAGQVPALIMKQPGPIDRSREGDTGVESSASTAGVDSRADIEGDADRTRLETSVIHATIVKQTEPSDEDTSLYHIFERLNSGGRRLADQEMRFALNQGPLISAIVEINKDEEWRKIFGKTHTRLKDQELILRFIAMLEARSTYTRPMSEFLSKFAGAMRSASQEQLTAWSDLFRRSARVFLSALPGKPFRLTSSLNVAVFDSCMVAMATRIRNEPKVDPNPQSVASAYAALLADSSYRESVTRSTADDAFVARRMEKAIARFASS
jgi:hypothetical protein